MCETDILLPPMTMKETRRLRSRVMNWDFRSGVFRKKPILTREEEKQYRFLQQEVASVWVISRFNARKNQVLSPLMGLMSLYMAGIAVMAPAPTCVRTIAGATAAIGLWVAYRIHKDKKIHRWCMRKSEQLLIRLEKGENIPHPNHDPAKHLWFQLQTQTLAGIILNAFNMSHNFGVVGYKNWHDKYQAQTKERE